jgi:Pyridoxamine 5'-phosphate oxidase
VGFAYLGTLRPDGRPRISPVEGHVWKEALLIGVMRRSLKARDLARDPRCTLQSPVSAPDSGDPELKLYCRAVPASDEPPGAWWTGRAGDACVFALEIEDAALVEWDIARGKMTVTSWSPARGERRANRSYP